MSNKQPGDSTSEKPCVVGLTGGLASGKSTVAKALAERGVPVIDADEVVGELYEPRGEGSAAVFDLFGAAALDREGGVDRSSLAAQVLTDESARLALEAAIHPLVRREIFHWIEGLGDEPVAVVEAALLIETGSYRQYDVLAVVWCERDQQMQRAFSRGVPDDRARGLLDAQLPLDEKRDRADVVIDNSGGIEDLDAEIGRAWAAVLHLCTQCSQA